jgi:hypothetical protein
MNIRLRYRYLALGAIISSVTAYTPAQPQEDPFIVGVGSHDLHLSDSRSQGNQLMRDAGIESVRTDAHWAFLERSRNRLKVEPHWPTYLAGTEAQGLDSLFILGYGNSFTGMVKSRVPNRCALPSIAMSPTLRSSSAAESNTTRSGTSGTSKTRPTHNSPRIMPG